jgi:hypothetical protein
MIKYRRNNIIFRIASSDALGKFKTTQAHTFVQLARKDLKFDDSAKEVVLLEYDRFSHWLFRIEKICFFSDTRQVNTFLLQTLSDLFDEEVLTIESVIDAHPDIFSKNVADFVKMVHRHLHPVILRHFRENLGKNLDVAYSSLVANMSDYLQYILIALHEFNNNILQHQSPPFLGFSGFFKDEDEKFLGLKKRADFFLANGIGPTFTFKNYSSISSFQEAHEALLPHGIILISEEATVDVIYTEEILKQPV